MARLANTLRYAEILMLRRTRFFGAMATAAMLLVAPVHVEAVAHAADHHTIILTFVRHAQSAANAAGVIDTSVPGPDITAVGFDRPLMRPIS